MQIDWWTLALQAVNFLVLVWLLWRFLYRPVKQVVEKRRVLAEQAFADAEKRGNEADAARRELEAQRAGLVRDREDLLARLHEEQEAERAKVLEQARAEAARIVEAAQAGLAAEREAAFRELRAQAATLAGDMAATLLGKVGATAPNGPFLEELVREFGALAVEERARLQKDAASADPGVTVATAAPLSEEEQAHWRARLAADLNLPERIAFVCEPDILGGAELRFPHAVLKFSWSEQLRKATDLVKSDDRAS